MKSSLLRFVREQLSSSEKPGDAQGRIDLTTSAVPTVRAGQVSPDQCVAEGKDFLSRQEFEGAEKSLRQACAAFPGHAPLWGVLATACWALGRHDEAMEAIQRATELEATEEFTITKGWMLFQRGELRMAEAVLRDATTRFPQSFSAFQNLTQVYKRLGCWNDGVVAAERACALDPGAFDMCESWAACLLGAERERDALKVIEEGLRLFRNPSSRFELFKRKAQAHEELGETDEAINALTEALEYRPDDEPTLVRLCSLTLSNGLRERARPYRQRLYEIDRQRLPDTLSDGLAALWERTNEFMPDPEALEWAWELADKSQWTRQKWQAAAAWGKGASQLLSRWRETAPARTFHQLDELVEPPDFSELSAAAVERSACFLVGAHMGPSAAVINVLTHRNCGYRVIGLAGRECREQDFIIPVTSSPAQAARAVAAEIKKGVTIGLAADDTLVRFYASFEFLGRHVEVPAFVPKLIRLHAGASFWYCPMWRNGKIVLQLERLPDPREDETQVEWCGRWFRAYLAKLEQAMRGRPEDLVMVRGIWGNVNPSVLRARRKMMGRKEVGAFAASDRGNS